MKGEALQEYKKAQKLETKKKLEEAIEELKASNIKVTISKVSTLSGIGRSNIYANYMEIFEKINSVNSLN